MSAPASIACLACPVPGSSSVVSYQRVSAQSAVAGSAATAARNASASTFTGL